MRGELIRAGGLPVALPHGLGRRREHLPRVEHLHQPEVRHSQHHAHDACGSRWKGRQRGSVTGRRRSARRKVPGVRIRVRARWYRWGTSRTGHDGGQLRALDLLAVLCRGRGFGGGSLILASAKNHGTSVPAVADASLGAGAEGDGARGSDGRDGAGPRGGRRAASREDGGVVGDDGGHRAFDDVRRAA